MAEDTPSWLLPDPRIRIDAISLPSGATIRVLRDDLLHPVASGNKLRKLDGYLPHLRARGVTDVLTCGGLQSSHAASVAALCAELGMRAHLLLRSDGAPPPAPTGYALLSELYAHRVHHVTRQAYADRQALFDAYLPSIPGAHAIPEGAAHALTLPGLDRLVGGLHHHLGPSPGLRLIVDSGTGATAAGLAIAIALRDLDWAVDAVMLIPNARSTYQDTASRLARAAGRLDREIPITWLERRRPRRFGRVFPGELSRVAAIARATGVCFDPIYTLAAVEHAEALEPAERRRALLVHTGGALGIFGLVQRFGPDALRDRETSIAEP